MHFTIIEYNQIIIMHDNGIETRIIEMRGPSTTYRDPSKMQLLFPFTDNILDEPFPTPARQKKSIKDLLITWYQEMNERGRYSAIMIEITSGALLSCRSTALGPYLMSPWLQLGTCQLECLEESSGSCGRLHTQTCITHQLHLTSSKQNRMCTRQ